MSLGILLSLLQPPFEGIINKACESPAPASYHTFVENRYKRGHQYFLGYGPQLCMIAYRTGESARLGRLEHLAGNQTDAASL